MTKSIQAGFYDLNIYESCFHQKNVQKVLRTLYNFGYRTIAVNQILEDANIESNKKKKKGEPREPSDCVPTPYNVNILKKAATDLELKNFTVYNRLTVVFSSQDSIHKILKSPNYKKYDIIAVLPTTMAALMFTCSNLDADILTFDPQNKMLKVSRKFYFKLIDRGYHFELMYSPAIEDSTKRKNIIHGSHIYHTFGKSKNIIISSGASNPMLLRSPYDVISIGFLFGLSELQCKSSVSFSPRNVIVNSVGRRHGKAVMLIENMELQEKCKAIVIDSDRSDEDMQTDEPAQKKSKQSINVQHI